jgi:hypothetical protein
MPPSISAGSCSASTLGLTDQPQDENVSSTEDLNRNGIPDAAEKIADGVLSLTISKRFAGYGDTVGLDAKLYERDGKTLIASDSFSQVSFNISKIVSLENNRQVTVYDIKNRNLSDSGVISDYASFTPLKVRVQDGKAVYTISSKYRDSDITLQADIYTKDSHGNVVVDTWSEPAILRVRGDSFGVTSKVKPESLDANDVPEYETSSSIEAGNQFGIVFDFDKKDKNGKDIAFASPYELRIFNDVTGEEIFDKPVVIPNASKESYIFKNPNIINKAGVYRFEFRDDEGFDATQAITVLPSAPSQIKVTPATTKFVK